MLGEILRLRTEEKNILYLINIYPQMVNDRTVQPIKFKAHFFRLLAISAVVS